MEIERREGGREVEEVEIERREGEIGRKEKGIRREGKGTKAIDRWGVGGIKGEGGEGKGWRRRCKVTEDL